MNIAARVFIVGLILAAASWELRADEEKKQPKDQLTDFTYLHKYWGLRLKAISILPVRKVKDEEFADIQMLFEFERDLTYGEVSDLRDAILFPNKKVGFFFQDKDNIIFYESRAYFVEGQVSGFKGDAIRLRTLDISPVTVLKAKKMIARQAEQ
jgi:hypothetical protein